jgi:hypothetical protein
MKELARQYVYWERYNQDCENFVKHCSDCQLKSKQKSNKVFNEWPSAKRPFERIHIDFFHFKNKTFLIFVDAFSRWMEIKHMKRTIAKHFIYKSKKIFSTLGYPSTIVMDNGPPQSNGLAERGV